jgi:hypothetical protein
MKITRAFIVIFLATLVAHADPTPTGLASDPILGQWIWVSNVIVDFKADGTAACTGGWRMSWKFLNNSEGQRQYRLIWNEGQIVDLVSLSQDKNTITITNQATHQRFVVRRRIGSDKAAPAEGSATPSYFGTKP